MTTAHNRIAKMVGRRRLLFMILGTQPQPPLGVDGGHVRRCHCGIGFWSPERDVAEACVRICSHDHKDPLPDGGNA